MITKREMLRYRWTVNIFLITVIFINGILANTFSGFMGVCSAFLAVNIVGMYSEHLDSKKN